MGTPASRASQPGTTPRDQRRHGHRRARPRLPAPRNACAVPAARIAAHTGRSGRAETTAAGAAPRASVPLAGLCRAPGFLLRDVIDAAALAVLTTTATSPALLPPRLHVTSVPSLIAPAPRGATAQGGRLADTPAMSAHGTGSKIPPTLLPVPDLSQSLHPGTGRVWNDHQLAAWLKSGARHPVFHDAVRGALLPLWQMARAATVDAIRTRIRSASRIRSKPRRAHGQGPRARGAGSPGKEAAPSAGTVLSALDEFRKGLETKLRFSGVGEKTRCRPTWPSKRCRVEMPRRARRGPLRARLLQLPTRSAGRRWRRSGLRPRSRAARLALSTRVTRSSAPRVPGAPGW